MKLIKKIFGVLILLLILTSISPQKAHALDGGAGYVLVAKEYGIDGIAWYVANRIIRRISAQTVNWINSGFRGNPAYVTNPRQFFLDTGDDVASRYLSSVGPLNQLCAPFRAQVRLALVRNYLNDDQNFSCSLSILQNNFEQFTQDFSVGGWAGWFEMTQNSSNNPYGAYLDAQIGLDRNVNSAIKKYTDQLNQAGGFLSFERCPDGMEITGGAGDQQYLDAGYNIGDCLTERETVTPGKVIETQLNESLSSGVKRLEAADEIDEIIGALLDQLINKALGSAGGLFGASRPDPSGRTYTNDLINDTSDEPPDREERECTTSPDGVDADGNVIPGITTCIANIPPSQIPPIPPIPVIIVGDETGGGSQCSNTGNVFAGDLRSAMDAVLAANPSVASLPNTDANNRENARIFLALVVTELQGRGFNATDQVLNGNGNPNTGDLIAIWNTGDTMMERYDAISGSASTVGSATQTSFVGFVPLDCTLSGGNRSCGCQTGGGGTPPPSPTPTPTPTPTPAPVITSINPTSVASGSTVMTITGTNLTTTVQFFDEAGNRTTVVGTLGAGATQTTVTVPAGLPVGNATVRIYANATTISNAVGFTVTSSIPAPPVTPDAPPITPLAQLNLGPGTFPDVTFFNGRIYLAVQQSGQLLLYSWAPDLTGQQMQVIPYQGGQAFPRLTVSGGILWLAFRGSDATNSTPESARLWRSDTQTIENLGGGFGNDPVAVQNGYVAWQLMQNGNWMVVRRALTGGPITTVRSASPTGISRILSNGSIVLIDEDRLAVAGHTRPWLAGGLTVSEGVNGGVFAFLNSPSSPFTSLSGATFSVFGVEESFTPHATSIGGGRYVVATWGIGGVRLALIQP